MNFSSPRNQLNISNGLKVMGKTIEANLKNDGKLDKTKKTLIPKGKKLLAEEKF